MSPCGSIHVQSKTIFNERNKTRFDEWKERKYVQLMNRPTINLQKLVDLTRIDCALFTVKQSCFHGKAICGTTPPLIRVHQERIVLHCSSVICSPVNVLTCKEHSNFINEDNENFRLSKLFRSHEKRVSRVFRTFELVEQLETKNLRLEIVTRDI